MLFLECFLLANWSWRKEERKEAKKRRKEEKSIYWGRITCTEDSVSESLGKHLGVFQGRQSVIWPWTDSSILPHITITATWFSLLHVFPFYFYTFLNHSSQHITYEIKREILFLFYSFKFWHSFFFSSCNIASLQPDWQGSVHHFTGSVHFFRSLQHVRHVLQKCSTLEYLEYFLNLDCLLVNFYLHL